MRLTCPGTYTYLKFNTLAISYKAESIDQITSIENEKKSCIPMGTKIKAFINLEPPETYEYFKSYSFLLIICLGISPSME